MIKISWHDFCRKYQSDASSRSSLFHVSPGKIALGVGHGKKGLFLPKCMHDMTENFACVAKLLFTFTCLATGYRRSADATASLPLHIHHDSASSSTSAAMAARRQDGCLGEGEQIIYTCCLLYAKPSRMFTTYLTICVALLMLLMSARSIEEEHVAHILL